MFETPLTVVGRIVTDPRRRRVADREVISFRVASNSRRRDADGNWEPGNSLYITVNCWGKLVTGVGAALGKGAAVIAVGQVYTSEYEDRDGVRRSSLEMRATTVGPDLSRSIVQILDNVSNVSSAAKDAEPVPTSEDTGPESEADEPALPAKAAEPESKADEPTLPAKAAEPESKAADPTLPAKAAKADEPTLPAKADQLAPPAEAPVSGKGGKAKTLPLSA
jgi:single-strand DNA-binding protein